MTKVFLGVVFGLVSLIASADEYLPQIDEMIRGLPKGWEAQITRPDKIDCTVRQKALFEIKFEFPSLTYEYDEKGGVTNKAHPVLWLSFYRPLSKEQVAEYEKNADEILHSSIAMSSPYIFAKTDSYWILTYHQSRHPKEDEIMLHMKEFLSRKKKDSFSQAPAGGHGGEDSAKLQR